MKKIFVYSAVLALFAVIAVCGLTSCKEPVTTPPITEIVPPTVSDTEKEIAYLPNGVEYVIDSDIACHITGIGNFNGQDLVIPRDDGKGRIVNYIADYAFADCKDIKSVTFPDSVKEIKGGAFQNCTGLERIALAEGMSKIGVWAFYGCTSLTEVAIPGSVDVIGQGSFSLCSSIRSFSVAVENESYVSVDGVIYTKDKKTLLIYPIGNTRTEFVVPDGVKTINNASFSDCEYLKTVRMASSVENIADHAFRRCGNLATVTLSESLTRIGVGSFYECKALKTVNYPGTKEKWEDDEQMELGNTWDRGAGKYTMVYDYVSTANQ